MAREEGGIDANSLFTAALQLSHPWKVSGSGCLQLAKRLARGFRSFRYFRCMAYLKAGRLQLKTPRLTPT